MENTNKKTQRDRVLDYLLVGAVRSRVSELIRDGYKIKKGWKKTQNKYGTSTIRTYYIEGE